MKASPDYMQDRKDQLTQKNVEVLKLFNFFNMSYQTIRIVNLKNV